MSAKPGKEWERQVGRALRQVASHVCNSNDQKPACDWRALLPGGLSLLVECKETEKDELRFDVITDAEYEHLTNHAAGDGLSIVLVSRVGPNWRRAWACTWAQWQQLERELGRRKQQQRPFRRVSKAYGGKLSLDPAPPCFVELERRDVQGIETWDLGPALDYLCEEAE
ncbi:MAG: hypothetical protein AMXMBFR33_01700 [Candidatus Xenobia bacterium]